MLKKPQNVYLPIDKFQAKVFKNADLSKRGEWVSNFALSLAGESNDDFAEELLTEAKVSFYKEKVRKWKNYIKNIICNENEGVVLTENEIYTRCCEEYGDEFVEAVELVESNLKKNKKKNPQDAPHCNAGVDSKSATSCDKFTADGDIREGSLDEKSGTSANIYATRQAKNGDAHHREAWDESATVSGNNSKGSARPSTDGDTRKDSRNITGSSNGASLESATSVENICGSAKTQAASNTGNVKPVTCRESGNLSEVKAKKPIAGGMLPSSSLKPPASPGAVDVLSLSYSGEFQNVKLTQEQYSELGIKFGNMQKLNRAIDSLSCKLENDELKPAPRSHYAVLVKWANYRDDMEEKEELKTSSAPHYETVSEHNRRVLENGRKWIDEHFPKKESANG